MSYSVSNYDPAQRRREKEVAREKDIERLKAGHVDAKGLARENGIFSSLKIAKVHVAGSFSGLKKAF